MDAPKNYKDLYGLRYAEFVVPLVKAVPELNEKNVAQEQLIIELTTALEEQKARLEKLEKSIH